MIINNQNIQRCKCQFSIFLIKNKFDIQLDFAANRLFLVENTKNGRFLWMFRPYRRLLTQQRRCFTSPLPYIINILPIFISNHCLQTGLTEPPSQRNPPIMPTSLFEKHISPAELVKLCSCDLPQ